MNRQALTIVVVAIVIAAGLAWSALFTVHQSQQALVLQFGEPIRVVRDPGLQVKLPMVQNVVYMDKRILSIDAPTEEMIAADQKRLVVNAFARYKIVDPLRFYQTVGNVAVAQSRLGTVINSSLRRVVGSAPFAAMLTGDRSALMRQISDLVNHEAAEMGIEMVDVRIKRTDLPEANSLAIYRRMQAEREREAKELRAQGAEVSQRIRSRADRERTVLLAEAKREAEVARGQGEGQSIQIFADAFGKDADFFAFYRSMKAYREALIGSNTTVVLTPDSDFFRFFGSPEGRAQAPAKKP
ncbi:MAG: protease modulator HflC [Alphaproteobacteria bacterium]|nr:protease modulator HflC [Alphaproteobacteria bacterium]